MKKAKEKHENDRMNKLFHPESFVERISASFKRPKHNPQRVLHSIGNSVHPESNDDSRNYDSVNRMKRGGN